MEISASEGISAPQKLAHDIGSSDLVTEHTVAEVLEQPSPSDDRLPLPHTGSGSMINELEESPSQDISPPPTLPPLSEPGDDEDDFRPTYHPGQMTKMTSQTGALQPSHQGFRRPLAPGPQMARPWRATSEAQPYFHKSMGPRNQHRPSGLPVILDHNTLDPPMTVSVAYDESQLATASGGGKTVKTSQTGRSSHFPLQLRDLRPVPVSNQEQAQQFIPETQNQEKEHGFNEEKGPDAVIIPPGTSFPVAPSRRLQDAADRAILGHAIKKPGVSPCNSRGRLNKALPPPSVQDLQFSSSPRAHSPRHRPGLNTMSRPFREDLKQRATPAKGRMPLAISPGSNISKRRTAAHHNSPNSGGMHSHGPGKRPSIFHWSPTFERRHNDTVESMARCINDLHSNTAEAWERAKGELETYTLTLEQKLATMSQQVSEALAEKQTSTESVDQLQREKSLLVSEVQVLKDERSGFTKRVEVLEEKGRTLKAFLNEAVKEHQELYNSSQAACQRTLGEVKAEQQSRKVALEDFKRRSEAIQNSLRTHAAAVVAESKQKITQLEHNVEILNRTLDDRNVLLSREKETVETLRRELEVSRDTQTALSSLISPIKELASKMDDFRASGIEALQFCQKRTETRFDTIDGYLSSAVATTSKQPEPVQILRDSSDQRIPEVLEKLDALLHTQATVLESSERSASSLQNNVQDMWQYLDSREDALDQQLQEKRQENAMLTELFEEKHAECQAVAIQLHDATESIKKQQAHIQDLSRQVAEMQSAPRTDVHLLSQLHDLESTVQQLNATITEKTKLIDDLQSKLEAGKSMFLAAEQRWTEQKSNFDSLLQEKELQAGQSAEQALEKAGSDLRRESECAQKELKQQLDSITSERALLQAQLADMKASLQARDRKAASHLSLLEAQLEARDVRIEGLLSEANETTLRFSQAQRPISSQVQDPDMQHCVPETQINSRASQKLVSASLDVAEPSKFLGKQDKKLAAPKQLGPEPETLSRKLGPSFSMPTDSRGLVQAEKGTRTEASCIQPQPLKAERPMLQPATGESVSSQPLSQSLEPQSSPLSDPPSSSTEDAEQQAESERSRSVMLRSPDDTQQSPTPLTIKQERVRRREGVLPRGILRAGTSNADTLPSRKPLGPIAPADNLRRFKRGQYNRPVSGKSTEDGKDHTAEPESTGTTYIKMERRDGENVGGESSVLRKRLGDLSLATKRGSKRQKRNAAPMTDEALEPKSSPPDYVKDGNREFVTESQAPTSRARKSGAFHSVADQQNPFLDSTKTVNNRTARSGDPVSRAKNSKGLNEREPSMTQTLQAASELDHMAAPQRIGMVDPTDKSNTKGNTGTERPNHSRRQKTHGSQSKTSGSKEGPEHHDAGNAFGLLQPSSDEFERLTLPHPRRLTRS